MLLMVMLIDILCILEMKWSISSGYIDRCFFGSFCWRCIHYSVAKVKRSICGRFRSRMRVCSSQEMV